MRREATRRIVHFGTRHRCPVCQARLRRFVPGGVVHRRAARCPVCGSLERHRLVWSFFTQMTDLFDGKPKRMLHLAPETAFAERLRRVPSLEYMTADIADGRAMLRVDVTDIELPDGTFDIIYASHVLEHVADDRRAMEELHRVLRPGGWAVLQVPIVGDTTIEDLSVTDPEERHRLFGQRDHLRRYGADYTERLQAAGFGVDVVAAAEVVGQGNCARLGVIETNVVFYCTKEPPGGEGRLDR